MARKLAASSEAKINVVSDNTDIIIDDALLQELGCYDTFAKQYIEPNQIVTGKITSARLKLVKDSMEKKYDGTKNDKIGAKELHFEIVIDNYGVDTIIDKKLCYALDLKFKKEDAVKQYNNRISNIVIGLAKQYGVKASKFVMPLNQFCDRIKDGKTIVSVAKVPFGVKNNLNTGAEEPIGYVLEFDLDKINKAKKEEK